MTYPTPNSSTGGYLQPFSQVTDDLNLDEFFQGVVRGISGISGQYVRPRWLPVPQPEPPVNVDWVAIGVIDEIPDGNAQVQHFKGTPANYYDDTGDGFDEEQRHVVLELMASFYGPNARRLANLFRDGLYIAQNREQLILAGMAFVNADTARHVPELINNVWRNRVDLTFRVRRVILRVYGVENLLEGVGTIVTDQGSVEGEARGTEPFDTANVRTP